MQLHLITATANAAALPFLQLAVPNQYSPGTDHTDRLSNNFFYYYVLLLVSLRDGNYMCATIWTVSALNQKFLLSVLILCMKFYICVHVSGWLW